MDAAALIFLSSGLFLGWSLGANDAANVFGTAVGTRMVQFTTAALICSVFVILGAVISGAGAAHTLGKLGAVNEIPGAFMVALAAGLTVYLMTKSGLPVSTTQAIVGAIVGWNLFADRSTDTGTFVTLVSTWVICPVLAAVIAAVLYRIVAKLTRVFRFHVLRQDAYTRAMLLLAGAFGAYSLGANNIANVMGVFVPVSPFTGFNVAGLWQVSSTQQLFLLGSVAIGVGVFTYSKRVMTTVGRELLPMSPIAAFVVVLSHSIVLFIFASQGLEHLLASAGLPTIPLVPVSSSQAVIGAVVGIGLLQGGRGLRVRVLGDIVAGWALTPLIAGVVCFIALFFLQNVFNQAVYRPIEFALSSTVLDRVEETGVDVAPLRRMEDTRFTGTSVFVEALDAKGAWRDDEVEIFLRYGEVDPMRIDAALFGQIDGGVLSVEQRAALGTLAGQSFEHRWMFDEALARASDTWQALPAEDVNKLYNRARDERLGVLYIIFRVDDEGRKSR